MSVRTFGNFSARARRKHTSIYDHLIQRGYTDEQIRESLERGNDSMRSIGLTQVKDDNSETPVLGLAYSGDYRYEEEAGLGALGKKLDAYRKQKDFIFTVPVGASYGLAVVVEHGQNLEAVYERALVRHEAVVPSKYTFVRETVKDMQSKLRSAGVKPIPTKREEVERLYLETFEGVTYTSHHSIGEFHYGDVLVMMTADPIILAVMEALEAAAKDNAVSLGSSANPFSRGVALYDVRDLSIETVKAMKEADRWAEARMKDAEAAQSELKSNGHLYAIRPGHFNSPPVHTETVADDGVYYYINYSPTYGNRSSVGSLWTSSTRLLQARSHGRTAIEA